jgi:tRNA nucleotidyltransferase (CCA-adding enzyme)
MNSELLRLCEAVRDAGGQAMLVGGTVRDWLLGIEPKDYDVEVYGLEPNRVREVLERIGRVNTVGEHFAVYKLVFHRPARERNDNFNLDEASAARERFEIDVSLPRRESKSGRGHRGFVIEGDPLMTFADAARRRDFTINAILYDPLTGKTDDPYGGKADLKNGLLRAVAADTFIEDSLRVLRAVQLAARFGMTIEPLTAELCRTIDLSDLPHERIWGEIEKLLTLTDRPSIGLTVALELGVLDKLFPEIRGLVMSGGEDYAADGLDHTQLALDEAVKEARDLSKPQRIAVMLATLCHDLVAALPAGTSDEHQTSNLKNRGGYHAELAPVVSVLTKMGLYGINGYDVRSQVLSLVREQRRPREFYQAGETTTEGDFRRLAQRVDIDLLYRVAKSCAAARGPAASAFAEEWFIEKARALGVEHGPPAPLLQGRHLIESGYEPGPRMGRLLRAVYELQLDGKVTTLEEALAAARQTG